jgi:hypothetical protein
MKQKRLDKRHFSSISVTNKTRLELRKLSVDIDVPMYELVQVMLDAYKQQLKEV